MQELTKKQFVGGVLILAAILAFFMFFNVKNYVWYGEGEINVFPTSESTKNYRLAASEIKVVNKRIGWFTDHQSYTVDRANWPDGGDLTFNPECSINYPATSAKCSSNAGEVIVEVMRAPDEPDSTGDDSGFGY